MTDSRSERHQRAVLPFPLYPAERARVLRQHVATLESVVADITSTRAWTRGPGVVDVGKLINALLAECVRADGRRQGGELSLVHAYFNDGGELRDDDEWIRHEPDIALYLPGIRALARAAKEQDEKYGTILAQQLASVIGEIVALVGMSDGAIAGGELTLAKSLLTTIAEA